MATAHGRAPHGDCQHGIREMGREYVVGRNKEGRVLGGELDAAKEVGGVVLP